MLLHVKVEINKTERWRIFAVFATEPGAIVLCHLILVHWPEDTILWVCLFALFIATHYTLLEVS